MELGEKMRTRKTRRSFVIRKPSQQYIDGKTIQYIGNDGVNVFKMDDDIKIIGYKYHTVKGRKYIIAKGKQYYIDADDYKYGKY